MSVPPSQSPCDRAREAFLDLEDGALAPERQREVREHVANCPACRAAWAEWEADARVLREALAPVSIPRDAASRAAAQVRRQRSGGMSPRTRRALQWGLAAAAALLVVLLGPWAWHGPTYVRVGTFGPFVGHPAVEQPGEDAACEAAEGAIVYDGAVLTTGEGERLTVRLTDGSRLTLEERTELRLSGESAHEDCGHRLPHVCLRRGEAVCKMAGTELFRAVGTPLGSVFFGGADFRVRYVAGERTRVELSTGRVRLSCPAGVAHIEPGQVWEVDAESGLPQQKATLPDRP